MIDRVVQFGTSPNRIGASNMQRLTLLPQDSGYDQGYHETPDEEIAEQTPATQGSPAFTLVGLIVVLAVLWLLRENSQYLQQEAFGINVYNLITITIVAVLGINLGKWAFTRFPVPGFTPLFLNT